VKLVDFELVRIVRLVFDIPAARIADRAASAVFMVKLKTVLCANLFKVAIGISCIEDADERFDRALDLSSRRELWISALRNIPPLRLEVFRRDRSH
jgi:hypothetical protein